MPAVDRIAFIMLGALFALTQCAPAPNQRAIDDLQATGAVGLRRIDIETSTFHLVSYARFDPDARTLRIYIEGDGHAWQETNQPSNDPTPWTPISMELAMCDRGPSVAYVARPCQFIAPGSDPYCKVDYWTQRRYAEPVIESTNEAVDRLKAASSAQSIELVGFSGGGAVAALVAARRHDVVALRTVAANLDTAVWTDRHGASPLTGSLNPADFTDKLAALPQLHFVGAEDEVVRLPVARAYQARFANPDCVAISVIPGAEHLVGWRSIWAELLSRPVTCGQNRTNRTVAAQR